MTTTAITVQHQVPRDDLLLGVIKARPVDCGPAPASLSAALDDLVARIAAEFPAEEGRAALEELLGEFQYWLCECGSGVEAHHAVVEHGSSVTL